MLSSPCTIILLRSAVRLGDGDLSDDAGVQRRLIRSRKLHPKYKRGQPYFDVAVLTLDPPADINNQFVRPICLPESASDSIEEFEGDQMDVAGSVCTNRTV